MEDFFDILESYANSESTPFAHIIVTLAFSGYPVHDVERILHECLVGDNSFFSLLTFSLQRDLFSERETVLNIATMAAATSVRLNTRTSPKRLIVATEAILEYLIDQEILQFLSTYSTHKSWLQRIKPGKHIATGSPRLASVCHTLGLRILNHWEDPYHIYRFRGSTPGPRGIHFGRLSMVLGPKYGHPDALRERRNKATMVFHLLEALLWLLPKVGFSEKIVLYLTKAFPWNIYQREAGLVRRVRKCFDRYTARVRNAQLEELDRRIENGELSVSLVSA